MGLEKRSSKDIEIEGPIQRLFCPVCCDGSRYTSNYSLRSHVKEEHSGDMKNECWRVSKAYINGSYDTEEFYSKIDEEAIVYIEKFDR